MARQVMQRQDPKLEECAQACDEARRALLQTIAHCMQKGGEHVEARHLGLMQDGIDATTAFSSLCHRGSSQVQEMVKACEEICEAVARDCDRFDDDVMSHCAETVRRCADACRTVAA